MSRLPRSACLTYLSYNERRDHLEMEDDEETRGHRGGGKNEAGSKSPSHRPAAGAAATGFCRVGRRDMNVMANLLFLTIYLPTWAAYFVAYDVVLQRLDT